MNGYKYVYDEYLDIRDLPNTRACCTFTTNRERYREYKSLGYQCATCETNGIYARRTGIVRKQ